MFKTWQRSEVHENKRLWQAAARKLHWWAMLAAHQAVTVWVASCTTSPCTKHTTVPLLISLSSKALRP